MRLLLINYEFPPIGGGSGTATAALAREFARLGIDVKVLTSAFAELPRTTEQDGYTLHRVPVVRRHADRSTVPEMITFILSAAWHGGGLARAWKPDASLAFFGIPGGPVALWLKWMHGVPYVVSLRGGDVPGHQGDQLLWHHRLTKPWIRLVWRNARAVVANSEGLRQQALRTTPDLPIQIIPNGVDMAGFGSTTPRRAAFSDLSAMAQSATAERQPTGGHGFGEAGPTPASNLLFVGRLSVEKGLHTLLDALATVVSQPWSLTLIGDGPQRGPLQAQAQRLSLSERITFAGWIPREQLPDHYRAGDLFVFPSTDEGMPNTVLEAMASGLPVVACRIAGCEDLVVHNETGLLVPPADAGALTTALAQMIGDASLRAQFGEAGRARVLKHFTWRNAAEAYVAALQDTP